MQYLDSLYFKIRMFFFLSVHYIFRIQMDEIDSKQFNLNQSLNIIIGCYISEITLIPVRRIRSCWNINTLFSGTDIEIRHFSSFSLFFQYCGVK